MSRLLKTAGAILSLGILLVAFNLGGSAGCGSDDGGGDVAGTDDATVTATDAEAEACGQAAVRVASDAMTQAFAGVAGLTVAGSNKADVLEVLKNALTITETASCTEGGVPSPSGEWTGTIEGDVSGDCELTADGTDTTLDVLIECVDYSDSNDATLDGALGLEATATDTEFEMSLGTDSLLVTLSDDSTCSIHINLNVTVTETTVELEGCVTVCGEGFSVTGSEAF